MIDRACILQWLSDISCIYSKFLLIVELFSFFLKMRYLNLNISGLFSKNTTGHVISFWQKWGHIVIRTPTGVRVLCSLKLSSRNPYCSLLSLFLVLPPNPPLSLATWRIGTSTCKDELTLPVQTRTYHRTSRRRTRTLALRASPVRKQKRLIGQRGMQMNQLNHPREQLMEEREEPLQGLESDSWWIKNQISLTYLTESKAWASGCVRPKKAEKIT